MGSKNNRTTALGAALVVASFFTGNLGLGKWGTRLIASSLYVSGNVIMAKASARIAREAMNAVDGNKVNVTGSDVSLPIVYGTTLVAAKPADIDVVEQNGIDVLSIKAVICVGSQDGNGIEGVEKVFFNGETGNVAAQKGKYTESGVFGPDLGPTQDEVIFPMPPYGFYTKELTPDGFGGFEESEFDILVERVFFVLGEGTIPVFGRPPLGTYTQEKFVGVAYADLFFTYEESLFSGGVPDVSFEVKGNRLYDPRDEQWRFSDNPALCILDYLTSVAYGAGVDISEIDIDSFIENANYYDEVVGTFSPYGENGITIDVKRGGINGVLSTGDSPESNIGKLLQNCRGQLVYQNGRYRLQVNKDEVPESFVLNQDVIVGDWNFSRGGMRDIPNSVKSFFTNRWSRYETDQASFPEGGDPNPYVEVDGGFENALRIDLPLVDNYALAHDIGLTYLSEAREDISFSVQVTEDALLLQVGDVVPVTHPTPGWTNKLFRIIGMEIAPEGAIRLYAQEYDANAYDLDPATSVPKLPKTDLPNPFFVEPPSNLVLISDDLTALPTQDGQYLPRIFAEWDVSPDAFVTRYEVEYYVAYDENEDPIDAEDADIFTVPDVKHPTSSVFITPVTDKLTYKVRVRAVNNIAAKSAWVEEEIEVSTKPGGALGQVFDIVKLDYFTRDGDPFVNVIMEIVDRGNLLLRVTSYDQSGDPQEGGPVQEIPDVSTYTEKLPETSGDNEGKYVWEVKLSEKHLGVVAYAIYYGDEDEPQILQRLLWLDVNDDANIVFVTVSYDERTATVTVKGDADTTELYAEESDDGDPNGTWYPVVSPTPAFTGNRFATTRRGSFSVETRVDRERFFRVQGRNSDGRFGPFETFQVDRYDDSVDPQFDFINAFGVPTTIFDPTTYKVGIIFRAVSTVNSVELSAKEEDSTTILASFVHNRSTWQDVDAAANIFSVPLKTSNGNEAQISLDVATLVITGKAYSATNAGGQLLRDTATVLEQFPGNTGIELSDNTQSAQSLALQVGSGLALNLTGTKPVISLDGSITPVTSGGTGRDILTAESVLVGDGINPVRLVTATTNGKVLGVVNSVWDEIDIPNAITGVTAGEGLNGGGTSGNVTLNVTPYQGTVPNRGKTSLELIDGTNKGVAVVLGPLADEAAPGNHGITSHPETGLTAGHVLRATSPTAYSFGAIPAHDHVLGDIKDAGTATGKGRIVVATSSGLDTVPNPGAVGQVLKVKDLTFPYEYEWGEVTSGVTSVTAGEGLGGGGSGSVTLNVNTYGGFGSGFGQTVIVDDKVAVVLGTENANQAAPGIHTHNVIDLDDSTTVGRNLVKLGNPSAIRFLRINANNTVSALTDSEMRTAIGAGTGNGTVTSVTGGTGLTGTITTTGSLALTGQALAVHNLATNGFIVRTSSGNVAARSIAVTGSNAITITNGDGVAANPTLQMAQPGPITKTSSNSNATNHTHALDGSIADVTVTGSAPTGSPSRAGSLHFVV